MSQSSPSRNDSSKGPAFLSALRLTSTAEADPDTRLPSLTNAGPIRPLRRGGTVLGDSLPSHRMR